MPSHNASLYERLEAYAAPMGFAKPHQIMTAVLRAVRKEVLGTDKYPYFSSHPRSPLYNNREFFALHEAVEWLCNMNVRPVNTHQLALEWPHQSQSDQGKVAYTRQEADATRILLEATNPRHSFDQKYTVTSLTKYLKRHWPQLPDHIIRDVDARFNPTVVCKTETDYRRVICIVNAGPRSCMTTAYGSIPFLDRDDAKAQAWFADPESEEPDWDRHPYTVYRAKYGWSLAYRTETRGGDTSIAARALVYLGEATSKPCYVRSYGDGGRDPLLENYLEAQGIEKRSSWPEGAKMAAVEAPREGYMMPYIDGNMQRVEFRDTHFIMDSDGESATDTCGTIDPNGDAWTCDDCGERIYERNDEGTTVGRHEDSRVCESCLEEYIMVRGQSRWDNYRNYYVSSDNAVSLVDAEGDETGELVDDRNPPECYESTESRHGDSAYIHPDDAVVIDGNFWPREHDDVVCLATDSPDGDSYALSGNAWYDGDGNWYHDDHEFIMYEGERWFKDTAWQCEATGWWYPEHVDQEVDPVTGDTVHPDYLEGCNRDADFIIVYGDDTCNAMPHIEVPTDSVLVFDATTSEVFALAD